MDSRRGLRLKFLHKLKIKEKADLADTFLLPEDKKEIEQLVEIEEEYKKGIDKINKEISAIQESTHTLMPRFSHLHHQLRQKYRWYYNWHTKNYAHIVHWVILFLYICALPAIFGSAFIAPNVKDTKAGGQISYDIPRWAWMNPTPTGYNIYALSKCEDSGSIWIGDAGGLVVESTDSGVTWEDAQYTGTTNPISSIKCFSKNYIIAQESDPTKMLQYDGESWTEKDTSVTVPPNDGVSIGNNYTVTVGSAGSIVLHDDSINTGVAKNSGTTNNLNSIVYFGTGKLAAVGDGGIITVSYNNGETWETKASGTTNDLTDVITYGTGKLIASGLGGTISISSDGNTWTNVDSKTTFYIESMTAFDTNNLAAIGNYIDPDTDIISYVMLTSTDGGSNWTSHTIDFSNAPSVNGFAPLEIIPYNATSILASGDSSEMISSSDYGSIDSWVTENTNIFGSLPEVMRIDNNQILLVGENGAIVTFNNNESYDSENRWLVRSAGAISSYYTKVIAPDMNHLLITGGQIANNVILSAAYSEITKVWTWMTKTVANELTDVAAFDATHYITTSYVSDDAGQNWDMFNCNLVGKTYTKLTPLNSTRAYAYGGSKTLIAIDYQNGNVTCANANVSPDFADNTNILSVVPLSNDVAIAVGRVNASGAVYVTNNASSVNAWTALDNTSNILLKAIKIDSTHVLATSANGNVRIFAYNESLNIWSWSDYSTGVALTAIKDISINGSTIVIVGNKIVISTDGGENWHQSGIYSGTGVSVIDSKHAIVVGYNNGALESYNLGDPDENWTFTDFKTTNNLQSIVMLDPRYVVAVGDGSMILRKYSPSTIATKLNIVLPRQSFTEGSGVDTTGDTLEVRAGDSVSVEVVASDDDNQTAKGIAYNASLSSNDPKAFNPAPFYLNYGLDIACDDAGRDLVHEACGKGFASYTFRSSGLYNITVNDAGGSGLSSGVSTDITVLPGDPYTPAISSGVSQTQLRAGVATDKDRPMTITLKDQFGNVTSSASNTTVHLSSGGSGRFSISENGPWTETLDAIVLAGQSTVSFFYLNYAEGVQTITSSINSLSTADDSTYNFAILPGAISNSSITADPNPAVAGTQSKINIQVFSADSPANRTVTIYSSKTGDEIAEPALTDGEGITSGFVRSTIASDSVLSIKVSDSLGDVWLPNVPTVTFTPAPVSRIDMTSNSNKDVIAGNPVSVKPSYFDRFNNPITQTNDEIVITSNDEQAILPDAVNKFEYNQIVLKSAGARTITVKDEATGASGSIDFTVYAAMSSVTQSLFETTKNILIIDREKADLKITIFDSFQNPIAGRATKIENDTSLGSIDNPEQKTDGGGQSKSVYTPLKEGKDTLTAFMPDNTDPTKNVAFSQTITIENRPNTLANQVASIIDTLQNNPTAKAIANAVQDVVAVAGILGLLLLIANFLGGAPGALHALNYGVSLTLEAAGIRKRRKYWGRVFDTTSGKGVDMVLVRLYDAKSMNLVTTAVTDIAGKYNFHPKPGNYVLSVSKEGYIFPTQIFAQYGLFHRDSKTKDQLIQSHYVGQPIEISEKNPNLNIEIPIDPVKQKAPFFLKIKLYARDIIDLIAVGLSAIFVPALIIGTLISIFTAIVLPGRRNIIFAIVYVVITIVFIVSKAIKSSRYGVIIDKKTRKPIPGAMISLFDDKYNSLKSTAVTDKFGRFTIFAPKGRYYLKVQKNGYDFGPMLKKKRRKKIALNNSGDKDMITLKDASYVCVSIRGEKK